MTSPRFNSQISLGNVLTGLGMAAGALYIFATMVPVVAANTARINDIETRVRVVEKDTHTLPVKLQNLAEDMDEIKLQLNANNRLIRELFSTRMNSQRSNREPE